MKQSTWAEPRTLFFSVVVLGILLSSIGCEWTSSGDGSSWSDSMSWVNFSGLYRSPSGGEVVADFSSTGSLVGSTGGSGASGSTNGTPTITEFAIAGQQGPVQASPFTVVSGIINYTNKGTDGWSMKPGSVDVTLRGTTTGPVGSFRDNGSGGLAGSYAQVPGGPTFPGTGSINYDTGAWTISLSSSDPFIQPAQISYSYVVLQVSGAAGETPTAEDESGDEDGDADGDNTSLSVTGGAINSIQIEQTGNQLTFRLSSGFTLTGQLSMVTLPGGDQTGRSAGDVTATYQVSGNIAGNNVKINGTLSGVYVPPADIEFANDDAPVLFGILSNRILQGIWSQPNGTGDLFAAAPQQSVAVNVGDFNVVTTEEQDNN